MFLTVDLTDMQMIHQPSTKEIYFNNKKMEHREQPISQRQEV